MGRWAFAAAEVITWWALLVGVWVTTLSGVTTSDMVAATAGGLLAALAARWTRRAAGGRWRMRPGWLGWLAVLPVAVVADAARLAGVAARHLVIRAGDEPGEGVGRLSRVPLPAGEDGPTGAGRRAAATLAVSATPGTFVVDVDEDAGELVVHRLVDGRPSVDRVVGR